MKADTTKTNSAAQLPLAGITLERFWRERAVEYQQRLLIIRLLGDIRTLEQQQVDLLRRVMERSALR